MSTLKLIGSMAVLVAVGAPMIWYLWEVLNQLLMGRVEGTRTLFAVPVLILFLGFLVLVSRTVRRWDDAGAE